MKKTLAITAFLATTLLLTGCGATTNVKEQSPTNSQDGTAQFNKKTGEKFTIRKSYTCKNPIAKISISPMKCVASKCKSAPQATGNLGAMLAFSERMNGGRTADLSAVDDTMGAMLVSSMSATGCFDVLDREALEEMRRELAFAGKELKVDAADYLITGTITALGITKTKSNFGGGFLPVIGSISSTTETAELSVDIRLLNVNTSRIEYTKTYDAVNSDSSYGVAMLGGVGGGLLGGSTSFGGSAKLGKAARAVINKAAIDLVTSIAGDQLVVTEEKILLKKTFSDKLNGY